jgi:response regulator NasT
VFSTNEPCDRATIHAAVKSGASAYVVDGIQPERVRSIVDSDVVQFESFQALRIELEETRTALEDHNVIEKAKGLIMRHESCDEDTAHRMLAPMPGACRSPKIAPGSLSWWAWCLAVTASP